MSVAVSIRLPEALEEALGRLAKALDRPKAYLVRKAVEAYLVEHADCRIAVERLRDRDEAILSGSELRKRLGL